MISYIPTQCIKRGLHSNREPHTNMPSQIMYSTASSKKRLSRALRWSRPPSKKPLGRSLKVSKSQIKLLYVDTSKREAADMMEWKRPERRTVRKD